jgi:hypothetical protein
MESSAARTATNNGTGAREAKPRPNAPTATGPTYSRNCASCKPVSNCLPAFCSDTAGRAASLGVLERSLA